MDCKCKFCNQTGKIVNNVGELVFICHNDKCGALVKLTMVKGDKAKIEVFKNGVQPQPDKS